MRLSIVYIGGHHILYDDPRPFIFYEVGGAGGIWGGSPKKKNGLEGGGHLKKIREKGGSRKILPLLEGGVVRK